MAKVRDGAGGRTWLFCPHIKAGVASKVKGRGRRVSQGTSQTPGLIWVQIPKKDSLDFMVGHVRYLLELVCGGGGYDPPSCAE